MGLLWGLESYYAKHLEQCLWHSKYSANVVITTTTAAIFTIIKTHHCAGQYSPKYDTSLGGFWREKKASMIK